MNVAILGATGAVGREMMKILAERSFPVEELRLLASPRSAGQKLLWQGRELTVQPAEDSAFEGMDIVLGAAENDIAKRFAPAIVKAGAVFVDNSSAFRMDPNVPLVIPEINPEVLPASPPRREGRLSPIGGFAPARPGKKRPNRSEREGDQHEKTHFYTIGSPVSAAVSAAHRSLCLADRQQNRREPQLQF